MPGTSPRQKEGMSREPRSNLGAFGASRPLGPSGDGGKLMPGILPSLQPGRRNEAKPAVGSARPGKSRSWIDGSSTSPSSLDMEAGSMPGKFFNMIGGSVMEGMSSPPDLSAAEMASKSSPGNCWRLNPGSSTCSGRTVLVGYRLSRRMEGKRTAVPRSNVGNVKLTGFTPADFFGTTFGMPSLLGMFSALLVPCFFLDSRCLASVLAFVVAFFTSPRKS